MTMNPTASLSTEAGASLLAIAVSANGRTDPREIAELDRLAACERLAITRAGFIRRTAAARAEIGQELSRSHWLRLSHRFRLADIGQAYELFSQQRDGVLKVAITP